MSSSKSNNHKKRKSTVDDGFHDDKPYEELRAENEKLKAEIVDLKAKLQREKLPDGRRKGAEEEDLSDDGDEGSVSDNANDPWSVMFRQLREHRTIHGDCKVPFKFPSNPKLGFWVGKQRKLNKKKELSQDRIDKLDGIDFVWGERLFASPFLGGALCRAREVPAGAGRRRSREPVQSLSPGEMGVSAAHGIRAREEWCPIPAVAGTD